MIFEGSKESMQHNALFSTVSQLIYGLSPPPSGGEKYSPIDGCSWGVFVALCNMTRVYVADALTDAELFFIIKRSIFSGGQNA